MSGILGLQFGFTDVKNLFSVKFETSAHCPNCEQVGNWDADSKTYSCPNATCRVDTYEG